MLTIYVDADACPVKDEVYRVAKRLKLETRVVANSYIQTPPLPFVKLITVGQGADVADDWIAEQAGPGDVVITADIPLAARCLEGGAHVIGTKGREFTKRGIGEALASRDLGEQLREIGIMTGGPAPMAKKDRERFLNTLDAVIQRIKRQQDRAG